MVNFRVEYYDEPSKEMVVRFVAAEDSNEVKSKFKKKGLSVCRVDDYKAMLNKYMHIMRPIR